MKKTIFGIILFGLMLFLTSCKNTTTTKSKTTTTTKSKTTTQKNTTTHSITTEIKKIDVTGYDLIWYKEYDLENFPLGMYDYYASEKGKWVLEINDTFWCEITLDNFEDGQKTTTFNGDCYLYTIAQASGVYLRPNKECFRTTKAYHLKEA